MSSWLKHQAGDLPPLPVVSGCRYPAVVSHRPGREPMAFSPVRRKKP